MGSGEGPSDAGAPDTQHLDNDNPGLGVAHGTLAAEGVRVVLVQVRDPLDEPLTTWLAPSQFPIIVGREGTAPKNSPLRLSEDTSLSKQHFQLHIARENVFLTDLDSRNGTFVNGRRVPPRSDVPIASGDLIRCGESLLVI